MSRTSRRAGAKALTRPGVTPRNVGSFRGRSLARLQRHISEVHRNRRTIKTRDV